MAGITKAERAARDAAQTSAKQSATPDDGAPPASNAERTSTARNGIANLTAKGDDVPQASYKAEDYEWDANGEKGGEKPKGDDDKAKKDAEEAAERAADEAASKEYENSPDGKRARADKDAALSGDTGAAPAPKISDDLVKRAGDLGLPPAVARAFETPEALTKYLDAKATAQQPAGEKKGDEIDNQAPFEFNADAFKDYPPEVQATLGGMAKLMKQQGEQLSAMHAELTKRTSSVELDIMDKAIDAIGDDKAFGKGATSGMADGEPATNRAKLIQAAQVLIAGREALGQPPLSMEQAFQKAYKLEFEGRVEARQNAEITDKVKKRVSQVLGRSESIPGAVTQQATMTPEQRAIQRGRALLAERGHTVGPQATRWFRRMTRFGAKSLPAQFQSFLHRP